MRILMSIALSLVFCACSFIPNLVPQHRWSVLTWNVENLFDDVPDGGEYPEFDPNLKWTRAGFEKRCQALARVVREIESGPPDVLALQEIENERVVRVLAERFLSDLGYRWYAVAPATGASSIRVALLSRIPLIRSFSVQPESNQSLRSLLVGSWSIDGQNFALVVNHWKSRIPTAESTEEGRRQSAFVLNRLSKQILEETPKTYLLAVGDFNSSLKLSRGLSQPCFAQAKDNPPDLEALRVETNALPATVSGTWFEPSRRSPLADSGTFVYRNVWYDFDHVFVEASAMASLHSVQVDVVANSEQLNAKKEPRGWSTFDPQGVSDHLPLLAQVEW